MILDTLMPPGMETPTIVLLLAASFATSFITAAFGIGGGAALLAILASLLPPTVLIPIHGVVQIGSNLGRAAILIRHVAWAIVPPFLAGSLAGAALGGLLVVNIPPQAVQVGVGLFILWSVFARPPHWLRRFAWLTGGVSSFLTMFFGATGPFVAAYVRALSLERHMHVATHATLMTSQHVLKTIVFGLLGFAYGAWLPFVVAMIAVGFLGTLTGRAVLTRIDDARFRLALNSVLVLLAARLIWAGLRG